MQVRSENFAYLEQHDDQLVRLAYLAERYFSDDPNTCLLKLRQFNEPISWPTAGLVRLEFTSASLPPRVTAS